MDGRWHKTSVDEADDPDQTIFPHCIPKECSLTIDTELQDGSVDCDTNMGQMIDSEFLGHVGSKCNIRCNEGFKMDYTDDASAWDKTKPLTNQIECLYDR